MEMKISERAQKAIDVFLNALEKGTLAKGTCTACAVGNLVAAGYGVEVIKGYKIDAEIIEGSGLVCSIDNTGWRYLFMTSSNEQEIQTEALSMSIVKENILVTDFTWQELAQIEKAFENATKINWVEYPKHKPEKVREDQLKGLVAAVEVILSFDQEVEIGLVDEVFTNKAKAIPIHV